MCEQEIEVNNHLFIHCQTATNLWNMSLCIPRVSWVMPKTTLELLNSWPGIGNRGRKEEWWMTIPTCKWWTIWKEEMLGVLKGKTSTFRR